MNFLAHCLLSCDDEHLLVGNFLADWLRNAEVLALPPAVQRGVTLHRLIDRYTDNHPAVRRSTARLQPAHRKYAPVLVDIYYDHLLASYWNRYSSESLSDFAQRQYYLLERYRHLMPPRLRARTSGMIAGNWLVQYGTDRGLRYTFQQVRKRLSRPEWLDDLETTLRTEHAGLTVDFHQFFPQLQTYVARQCLRLSAGPTQQLSEEE